MVEAVSCQTMYSAVARIALLMTIAGRAVSGNSGNSGIQCYTAIQHIRLYSYSEELSREELSREWSELDLPHSRPRACARVTMRVRIMRARARARTRARGDKQWICSRIIEFV